MQTGTLLCSSLWHSRVNGAGQGFGNLCCLAQLISAALPAPGQLMSQLCCELAAEDLAVHRLSVCWRGTACAWGLCGSAAAHACPSVVMEREKFFSFDLVRLYRLDSPTTVASLVSVLCLHKKIFALSGVSTFHFFWLYQLKIASCFSLPIYLSQKEIDTALVRFVSNFSKVFLVQLLLKKKWKREENKTEV